MERRILNILEAEAQRTTPHSSQAGLLSPLRNLLESVIPSGATKSRSRGTGSPESSLSGVGGIPVFRDARATKLLRWAPIAAFATLTVAALIVTPLMRHHDVVSTQTSPAPAPTLESPIPTVTNTTAVAAPTPPPHASAPHLTQPRRTDISLTEQTAPLSHPAPPIPLTAQERLLLRYARRGRTDDLAQISNDRKAAREEQEAAEFQAFFAPIKIGESE
jgi:hypothetical protein